MALISSLADFTSLSIMFVVFCCRNFALIMKISDKLEVKRCVYFLTILNDQKIQYLNMSIVRNHTIYDFQSVIFSFLILSSLYKYFNIFIIPVGLHKIMHGLSLSLYLPISNFC